MLSKRSDTPWTPARRMNIPKKSGGTRPGGERGVCGTSSYRTWSAPSWKRTTSLNFGIPSHGFLLRRGCDHGPVPREARWKGHHRFIWEDTEPARQASTMRSCWASWGMKVHDNRLLRFGRATCSGRVTWRTGSGINTTLAVRAAGGVISPLPVQHLPGPGWTATSKTNSSLMYTRLGKPCAEGRRRSPLEYLAGGSQGRPGIATPPMAAEAGHGGSLPSGRSVNDPDFPETHLRAVRGRLPPGCSEDWGPRIEVKRSKGKGSASSWRGLLHLEDVGKPRRW